MNVEDQGQADRGKPHRSEIKDYLSPLLSKIDFQRTPDLVHSVVKSIYNPGSEACMNKFTSIFGQMVTLFPALDFEKAIKKATEKQQANGSTKGTQRRQDLERLQRSL